MFYCNLPSFYPLPTKGDGRIVVTAPSSIAGADSPASTTAAAAATTTAIASEATPVDLPLSLVLGKMPQKHFHLISPANVTVHNTSGKLVATYTLL